MTDARDPKRYRELVGVAENDWAMGTDCTAGLIDLAERLLRAVEWRDALARACTELLEGDWAQSVPNTPALPGPELWPHQRQGIAQLLYILERVRAMTPARERANARHLADLGQRHALMLTFDRRPSTLALLQQEIAALNDVPPTALATGEPHSRRARGDILRTFAPDGGEPAGGIALCSDGMAEAVNLQRASALVHVDLPRVVRIAEQRAGRVDRMDGPHTAIEIWWPREAQEFGLTSDDRLVERYDAVESLLGSNFPLRDALSRESARSIDPNDVIAEYESGCAKRWDGIDDAFAPVRALTKGADALIDGPRYEGARGDAGARALVSVVSGPREWAFFCLYHRPVGALGLSYDRATTQR